MKTRIWVTFLLAAFLAMGMASAAATMRAPLASGKMSAATYAINISVGMNMAKNCTVTFTSVKASDSQTYLIKNASASKNSVLTASNTALLIDSNDYTVAGTCYNYTGTVATITAIGSVIVDNTKPLCAFSGLTNSNNYDVGKTWTVNAANASAATIKFATVGYSMTEASDVFTYVGSPITSTTVLLEATSTDGTNTTTCTSYTLGIVDDTGDSGAAGAVIAQAANNQQVTVQQQRATNNKTKTIVIVGALAVLGYLWYKKGKGKR